MAKRKPPPSGPTLLDAARERGDLGGRPAPLAERMRPARLEDVVGQEHLLGANRALAKAILADRVASMILWGPPGSGKTTLAQVIAQATRNEFVPFSAVLSGVAELRTAVAAARDRRAYEGTGTLLFVDEIHRFNKAQQDAFLPHVENGTITLIGATTENPSFAVNAAVLSRCKVFRLEALTEQAVVSLLERALRDPQRGLGKLHLQADPEALGGIARMARGDARRALNMLEAAADLAQEESSAIDVELTKRAVEESPLLYDKAGEEHYNVVSALIKSMRGSDPDAAIYWLMRMVDAGDDPLFLLRRLIIFASEDVGNADPRALTVAVDADHAFRRLGMPEGLYPLAHACLYLAVCPKSNAVGRAFTAAREAIARHGALPVPKRLRNAVTGLMKADGYGEGYRSAHDFGGHVPGERYLPDALAAARYYEPSENGFEQRIRERLVQLRQTQEDSTPERDSS